MCKIYHVKCIYEVYLYYQIKICVHLTYLSFTLGVPDTLISNIYQGCHWSGKSQGNSRSGKSQGILEFVREIWNFVESQENSRKVREI